MVENKKPWYKSKTLWLGVLTAVAGAGPLMANWTAVMSPTTYAIGLTAVGAANVVLRFVTSQGIQ